MSRFPNTKTLIFCFKTHVETANVPDVIRNQRAGPAEDTSFPDMAVSLIGCASIGPGMMSPGRPENIEMVADRTSRRQNAPLNPEKSGLESGVS